MRRRVTSAARRRQQRRRFILGTVAGALLCFLLVAMVVASYEAGTSQYVTERDRLLADLQVARERNRLLHEESAFLRQRLADLRRRYRELHRRYEEDATPEELRRLVAVAKEKRRQGVDLGILVTQLEKASNLICEEQGSRHRLFVAVPLAKGPPRTVTLAGGRIRIAAEGAGARDTQGRPLAWFDPKRPVRLRIVRDGGDSEVQEGLLPLEGRIPDGSGELRFQAEKDSRRGFISLVVRACRARSGEPSTAGEEE